MTVKSSAHATSGYYDALARAEQRARSAERRLATIEQMLTTARPDEELHAALATARSWRKRFLRVVAQTISLTR